LHVIDLVRDMMVTLVTVGYEKLGLTPGPAPSRGPRLRPSRRRSGRRPRRSLPVRVPKPMLILRPRVRASLR
jgi:hypothetical protein